MAQYRWREGTPAPKVDAQIFGEEIERIASMSPEGVAQPSAIIDAARDAASPIHAAFVWDDSKAADAYRRDQARGFVRSLEVVRVRVEEGEAVSNRGFHMVRRDSERGYMPERRVMNDRDLRAQVVSAAKKELETFVSKYERLLQTGPYIARLRETIDAMRDEIDQLETETNRRRPVPRSGAKAVPQVGAQ